MEFYLKERAEKPFRSISMYKQTDLAFADLAARQPPQVQGLKLQRESSGLVGARYPLTPTSTLLPSPTHSSVDMCLPSTHCGPGTGLAYGTTAVDRMDKPSHPRRAEAPVRGADISTHRVPRAREGGRCDDPGSGLQDVPCSVFGESLPEKVTREQRPEAVTEKPAGSQGRKESSSPSGEKPGMEQKHAGASRSAQLQ